MQSNEHILILFLMLMNFICTYTIYMSEFLAQLTDPLTKSISTILRRRKRGNIGNAEWGGGGMGELWECMYHIRNILQINRQKYLLPSCRLKTRYIYWFLGRPCSNGGVGWGCWSAPSFICLWLFVSNKQWNQVALPHCLLDYWKLTSVPF